MARAWPWLRHSSARGGLKRAEMMEAHPPPMTRFGAIGGRWAVCAGLRGNWHGAHSWSLKLDSPTLNPQPQSLAPDTQTLVFDSASVEHRFQTVALHSLPLALDSLSFKFSTSECRVPVSNSRWPRAEAGARQPGPGARLSEVENFERKQRRSTVWVPCVNLPLWNTSL